MYHDTEIRVRYAETDAMGIAHHAAYLVWFEEARTEMCRAAGIRYRELEDQGFLLPVVEIVCRYRRPLHYDDALVIRTSVAALTRRSLRFRYEVHRDAELCAEGESYHIVTDRATRRPCAFAPATLALLRRWTPPGQAG
jgi:acyl-CoA thioester hydrolase